MWCRAVLVVLVGILTTSAASTFPQQPQANITISFRPIRTVVHHRTHSTINTTPTSSIISTSPSATNSTSADSDDEPEQNLKVGRAINIFSRYGYLSLSMRVIPRNDSNPKWIFREPTVDIFTNIDNLIVNRRKSPSNRKSATIFDGDFHMEFCDDLVQLVQAYFRDFKIERLQKPWHAFSGSWTPEIVARNLGINASFAQSSGIGGEHCYVLVRVSRFRDSYQLGELPKNVEIADKVLDEMNTIRIGESETVEEFIRKFGSHYISSYVTGNSLYQVFVFSRKVYIRIRERLKTNGINNLGKNELSNYFSPWYAEHMGQIKVASGNTTLEAWAAANLKTHYYIFSYASLIQLHSDTTSLRTLNGLLGNEALLQLELKTLTPAFKDPTRRQFYQEVLDNYLKLWEVNM